MCSVPVPEIRECAYGGFLAVSPDYAPIKIGVQAATKKEVWKLFRDTYRNWAKSLKQDRIKSNK
jgi:hypothetical protein